MLFSDKLPNLRIRKSSIWKREEKNLITVINIIRCYYTWNHLSLSQLKSLLSLLLSDEYRQNCILLDLIVCNSLDHWQLGTVAGDEHVGGWTANFSDG